MEAIWDKKVKAGIGSILSDSLRRQKERILRTHSMFSVQKWKHFFRQNIVRSGAKSALKEVNPVRLSLAPFFSGEEESGAYVLNNLLFFLPTSLSDFYHPPVRSALTALSSISVSCLCQAGSVGSAHKWGIFFLFPIIITTLVSDLY